MGAQSSGLSRLQSELAGCRACPRLVTWREQVAHARTRFDPKSYWAAPVPGFGDAKAGLVVLGLAPGAHGANRTGRPFTGDGAGVFLYSALHAGGLASLPVSIARTDALKLTSTWITNVVRCVPPGNRPTPVEIRRCRPFLERELLQTLQPAVILCLGQIAWNAALDLVAAQGMQLPRPRPRFAHGAEFAPPACPFALIASYHTSQLNTRTGRLSPAMFAKVLARARTLCKRRARAKKAREEKAPD